MSSYKWAILIFLALTLTATAQVSQTAVQFLLIAPGARAGGMGETFVAISDDATAVHWNPAGLGRYPLSGTWMDLNAGRRDTISAMTLVKNAVPEVNYKQYDIWGLVDNKVARWDGRGWVTGISTTLKEGGTLQNLIERYTGLSETDAEKYVDKIARANNELTPETIDSLKSVIMPILPSDYTYREEIEYGFEKLHNAWLQLRINMGGIRQLENDITKAQAENPVQNETLDKIAFGFDRAITSKSGKAVWIPYNLILPEKINCLESDDDYLYLGTDQGFFRFEPLKLRWSSYSVKADSLPSDTVTSMAAGNRVMLIGTDKGIVKFTGRKVLPFDTKSGAPDGRISAITAGSDKDIWASSGNDLFHFDGTAWRNYYSGELSIGESLSVAIRNFYGDFGKLWNDRIMGEMAGLDPSNSDSLSAGQKVSFPYKSGFRGEVTRLGIDPKGNLWIGTTEGIVYFNKEGFRQFGYKVYTVADTGMTVNEVAAQYIPDRDQAKVEKLAAVIKDYNELQSDTLQAGDNLFVYANALGSEITAIEPISANKALISTAYGTVEFDKGKWSRLQNQDLSSRKLIDIRERNNELWVATPEKVSVFASAKRNITFMHSNYLVQLADDLYYDYFSIVYPTREWGTFGMGVTFLSYGKQERRSEGNVDQGTFYSYDIAFTLSYGARLLNNLSGGLSVRYINSHLAVLGAGQEKGKGTGYSLAVDGGVLYDLSRRLTLGATVTNLGPDIAYIDADQADPLPRKLAVGFNYRIVDSPFNRLSFLGEADKILVDLNHSISTEIKEVIPHLGLEYWYSNYVALRSGYVYDKVGVQRYFTLGASLQYTNYRFDFSYIPSSSQEYNRLGNTMRFSMNVGF